MIKAIAVILSIVFLLENCTPDPEKKAIVTEPKSNFSYRSASPDKRYELPQTLHEISGIAAINDSILACIADEKGTVCFFNLNTTNIDNKIAFSGKGDFEDLTVIGDTIYVLDSKGVIWSIKHFSKQPLIISTKLNIERPFELEGICHRGDTLFVAANITIIKKEIVKAGYRYGSYQYQLCKWIALYFIYRIL